MRRILLLAVASGTLVLGACSDKKESPTEPNVSPPGETFGNTCSAPRFPLLTRGGVVEQIKNVFPVGRKRLEALAGATAVAILWDTCHPQAARRAAVALVNWIDKNAPNPTSTQVTTLKRTILNAVGIPFDPPTTPGDFGIGYFDATSNQPLVVETTNGTALTEIPAFSFAQDMIVRLSRNSDDDDLHDFDGQQFPPNFDYDVQRVSGTTVPGDHVLLNEKTAIVAFCLLERDDDPAQNKPPYPADRRIGHNPVAGAGQPAFEILDPVDVSEDANPDTGGRPDLGRRLDCPKLVPTPSVIDFFGAGLPGFATAAWSTAGRYLGPLAQTLLLPEQLVAAMLETLPPPPPIGGKARSLSPFKVVGLTTTSFGFENGEPAWTGTVGGFWNRNTFVGVVNEAFDKYVNTVGNELPNPFAGQYSAWYGDPVGDPLAGNFLGLQATGDPDLSGGTSVAPNGGSFTSPEFSVPNVTNPVQLQLKTWWEIESVNPKTFDLMDIVLVHGGIETVLKRLNPLADPPAPVSALAYTSAGFNLAPDWQDVAIDLSAYKGQTVRLKLAFNTGDFRYNGFRGWIVDEVAVRILETSPFLSLRTNALQSAVDLVPADKMTFPERSQ